LFNSGPGSSLLRLIFIFYQNYKKTLETTPITQVGCETQMKIFNSGPGSSLLRLIFIFYQNYKETLETTPITQVGCETQMKIFKTSMDVKINFHKIK